MVSVDAATGNVELTAATSIDDAAVDTTTDITAAAVSLVAASVIGALREVEVATANLTLDTNNSFDVDSTLTLTDLTLTVDPANTSTYALTDATSTFTLADNGLNLDVTAVTSAGNLNLSATRC